MCVCVCVCVCVCLCVCLLGEWLPGQGTVLVCQSKHQQIESQQASVCLHIASVWS